MNLETSIKNYFELKNSIDSKVEIAIVTKGIEKDFLIDFITRTGHKFYAENYTKELKKWEDIKIRFNDIKLSFIGSFQSGNIKNIVKVCDRIESFSSVKSLEKVKYEALKKNKELEYYMQVNIGGEVQKNGFLTKDINPEFGKLFTGIMCIPPAYNSHIYFAKVSEIAKNLGISKISMGMSGDYKKAIENGATEIRIGSLIFNLKK